MLTGVSRVFHSRLEALSQLDGFERAWGALMDTVRKTACSPSKEVCSSTLAFKRVRRGGEREYIISIVSCLMHARSWAVLNHL